MERALEVAKHEVEVRGNRDFDALEIYWSFIEALVEERNATREQRFTEEPALLRPLPVRTLPTWREEQVTVKRWSIIRVANKPYSLPSRLIGHRVQLRLYANHLEVRHRGALVARPERVRGGSLQGIDYRHLVHSLVRKPGAFRRSSHARCFGKRWFFHSARDSIMHIVA